MISALTKDLDQKSINIWNYFSTQETQDTRNVVIFLNGCKNVEAKVGNISLFVVTVMLEPIPEKKACPSVDTFPLVTYNVRVSKGEVVEMQACRTDLTCFQSPLNPADLCSL